jgi:hypothetical protein
MKMLTCRTSCICLVAVVAVYCGEKSPKQDKCITHMKICKAFSHSTGEPLMMATAGRNM